MAPLKVITDPSATQRKPADVQNHFLNFSFFLFFVIFAYDEQRVSLKTKCFTSNTHKNQYQCSGLVFASSVVKSANNLDLQILELMIRLSFSFHNHFNSSCYYSTTHR